MGLDFNLAQDVRGVLRQAEIIRARVVSSDSELVPKRRPPQAEIQRSGRYSTRFAISSGSQTLEISSRSSMQIPIATFS